MHRRTCSTFLTSTGGSTRSQTAIRLVRRDHGWDAQWCLGDRDFDIPAELSVYDAADRFVRHFRQSHRPIGFHNDAAQAQ